MGIFVASLYLIVSGYFLWAAYCLSSRLNKMLLRGQSARGASSRIYFHILGLVDSNFFRPRVKNSIVWFWALTAAVFFGTESLRLLHDELPGSIASHTVHKNPSQNPATKEECNGGRHPTGDRPMWV